MDQRGEIVAPGDLETQTKHAMKNLFATLRAAGSAPRDVLKTTVFVATSERADLVRAWNVVKASFKGFDPPSTLLGVSVLGYRDQLVEVEAVAIVDRSRASR